MLQQTHLLQANEEAVVVVDDSGHKGQDQTTRPSALGVTSPVCVAEKGQAGSEKT